MQKLTKEQAIVLTGHTGLLCSKFSDFHEDVEKRMGRPVFTHEFANKEFFDNIKEIYKQDFLNMLDTEETS